ncbi:nuclear transport factor 2 family protein [Streptomyces coeruleorubidus]|uniref:nuclear transport factor 2 family protein n=2 Tax=Streptomyces coeruleorubidus TaxID=116188 RepID=UPI0033E20FAD
MNNLSCATKVVDMPEFHEHPNVRTAVRYHQAVSRFAAGEELAAFFHPDAVHTQLPNALFPDGTVRHLPDLIAAAQQGHMLLAEQHFEVINAVAAGDQVALEVTWSGTLAVPLGDLTAGQVLRTHIAAFLEFRDGKIIAQRDYDCYERLRPAASNETGRQAENGKNSP